MICHSNGVTNEAAGMKSDPKFAFIENYRKISRYISSHQLLQAHHFIYYLALRSPVVMSFKKSLSAGQKSDTATAEIRSTHSGRAALAKQRIISKNL